MEINTLYQDKNRMKDENRDIKGAIADIIKLILCIFGLLILVGIIVGGITCEIYAWAVFGHTPIEKIPAFWLFIMFGR